MIEFIGFPKIPRLNREVIITEKIDGTNAVIYVPEDDDVDLLAGSHHQWLVGRDNHGFAAWVRNNKEQLRQELGPGYHYGEWWGSGIQRGYGLTKGIKYFSLFNTTRWMNQPLELCRIVPILKQGILSSDLVEDALDKLGLDGSFAAPGFRNPEGIVVFHTASNTMFKVTLLNDSTPKTLVRESCGKRDEE